MPAINVKTETKLVFVGPELSAKPVIDFETKEQTKDKLTNQLVWKLGVTFTENGEFEKTDLKIVSAEEPKLTVIGNYRVIGDLFATPYIANGSTRVSVSWKLVGKLVPVGNAAPESK